MCHEVICTTFSPNKVDTSVSFDRFERLVILDLDGHFVVILVIEFSIFPIG